jgi:hypothetical protein
MCQRAGQRAFPVSLGWVDDHSGRLIDDDNRIILVQDRQRDILGRGPFARHVNLLNKDFAAHPQPQRWLAYSAVNAHMAGVDRTPQCGSAECMKMLGQKYV